jgi:hypothetical protein
MIERPMSRSGPGMGGESDRLTPVEELNLVLGRVDAISASISSADVKAGILLTADSAVGVAAATQVDDALALVGRGGPGGVIMAMLVVGFVVCYGAALRSVAGVLRPRLRPGFGANRFAFPSLARWPWLAVEPMEVGRLCGEAVAQLLTVAEIAMAKHEGLARALRLSGAGGAMFALCCAVVVVLG